MKAIKKQELKNQTKISFKANNLYKYRTEEESAGDKLPRMLVHDQDIERVRMHFSIKINRNY